MGRTQRWLGGAAASTLLAGLAASGLPAAQASDREDRDRGGRVGVEVTPEGIDLARSAVAQRTVTLSVETGERGASLHVFQPDRGVGVQEVLDQILAQFDPEAAAASTRFLTERVTWFGGTELSPDQSADLTMRLDRGRYFLVDINEFFDPVTDEPTGRPEVVSFRVTGSSGRGGPPRADARVRADDADTGLGGVDHGHVIETSGSLPDRGTVRFDNHDEVIHFFAVAPVAEGTTDDDIAALFAAPPPEDPDDPGPFLRGPSVGMGVLSPGERAWLTYSVPEGDYLVACFVADEVDDLQGLPHAFLGMFRVVPLG